jgi:nucleoside-diphosphate-sugar epimerase
MRVLVTGGAGFLGQSVVAALASGPHEVLGLVRSTEQSGRVTSRRGTPVVGDVLDPATLEPAVEGCDLVIHLAQSSAGSLEER